MDLHPGEDILFDGHPSWRATLGFYVLGFVGAVAAGIVAGVAAGTTAGVIVVVVALALVVLVGLVRRLATHYLVTTERLRIRRGILSRHVQQTQLGRVQNVNTNQSFFERVLQIGTVDFDTAGTEDSDFTFRGIADPEEVVGAVDRAQRLAADRASAGA
ncbi:MAG: hypothetical protein QOH72_4228 [Solirubrobacteraceae bacterium]|jgi:uncharacterized membrane protein YdbT with pleckstrin-like domain|nr:hypothetical protein [Solirubrobacteraceae bacterium]